ETAELDREGMQLDLGGIAKGFAADEALATLASCGIHSALVAASGDLAFSDAPPGEAGWKVGVDSYDRANAPFTRILLLSKAAVSTSGPSEQNLEVHGVRYSHILNPATGIGLTGDITVTAIARRGIDADPIATAVSVLGPEKGLAFVEKHPGVSAVILTIENGTPKLLESKTFSKLREQP
ncbi:MAG: FAD:protein FMN transferase, partial [Acidobacteriota bacterium]|nr:FAD:protein FMN transferase [Acidobacteriota bacterium]